MRRRQSDSLKTIHYTHYTCTHTGRDVQKTRQPGTPMTGQQGTHRERGNRGHIENGATGETHRTGQPGTHREWGNRGDTQDGTTGDLYLVSVSVTSEVTINTAVMIDNYNNSWLQQQDYNQTIKSTAPYLKTFPCKLQHCRSEESWVSYQKWLTWYCGVMLSRYEQWSWL